MNNLRRALTCLAIAIAWAVAWIGVAVLAQEVYDQARLKAACELDVPRSTRCIVAYHPVEIVEWSNGVERKGE